MENINELIVIQDAILSDLHSEMIASSEEESVKWQNSIDKALDLRLEIMKHRDSMSLV